MTTITAEQFEAICSDVWRDRIAVVSGRGFLSDEAALVRAVYWRLCKAGLGPSGSAENYYSMQGVRAYQLGVGCLLELNARPSFDGAPFLNALVQRYQNEVGQNG